MTLLTYLLDLFTDLHLNRAIVDISHGSQHKGGLLISHTRLKKTSLIYHCYQRCMSTSKFKQDCLLLEGRPSANRI